MTISKGGTGWSRRPSRLAVSCVAIAALTACSTSDAERSADPPGPVPSIATLLTAARSAGPATLDGDASGGPVSGSYDPDRRLAALRFPVAVADQSVTVEARRMAATTYLERGAADATVIAASGPRRLAVRPAEELAWTQLDSQAARARSVRSTPSKRSSR